MAIGVVADAELAARTRGTCDLVDDRVVDRLDVVARAEHLRVDHAVVHDVPDDVAGLSTMARIAPIAGPAPSMTTFMPRLGGERLAICLLERIDGGAAPVAQDNFIFRGARRARTQRDSQAERPQGGQETTAVNVTRLEFLQQYLRCVF